mgnify:CR=1 FL=1
MAGLELLALYGIEGPGWLAPDFEERWQTDEGRRAMLESARMRDTHAELQVLSAHLLALARRR